MRRLLITSLIVLLAAVLLPAIAHARTTFIVTGFGWGHGVGMSQYGAYGLAQQGASFDAILATYYPGTTLAPVDPTVVRVLLASERASIKLASPSPYTVTDGAGVVHELPAGSTRIKRDFSVITSDGKLALTGPLRFAGGEDPLAWERPYRGAMIVTEEGGRLRLINEVGLESYLYGVVPSEMSPSWDAEALKAQAVAARSFALSTRGSDDDFELFADTRSQVYRGRDVEHESTTAAVDATSGLALYYEGRIASTFFSASSGGRTAAIEDVFLGSAPVPYLRAVDDPTDRVSPFFRWGPIALSSRQLGAQLGPPGPGHPLDATVQKNASGRVGLLVVAGRKKQAAVDGPTARTRLGLRSTGFDVAVASLRSLPRRVIYGEKALVSGTARGLGDFVLERQRPNGSWATIRRLSIDEHGAFAKRFGSRRTLRLRLSSPLLAEAGVSPISLTVKVAPRVTLRVGRAGTRFRGRAVPAPRGSTVRLERQGARGWRRVGASAVRSNGRFVISRDRMRAGTYRVTVEPGGELVRGVSGAVQVPR